VATAALTGEELKVKAKETEIHGLQQSLEEVKDSWEEAKCQVSALELEKTKSQENARQIEYKVREELNRANLTSKDQNRAWFEQELHKLNREKLAVEKSEERLKEQLDIAKRSSVCSSSILFLLTRFINGKQEAAEQTKRAEAELETKVQFHHFSYIKPAD
jgi:predicted  nucleic acid-binding Zn-ribbon protein